MEGIQQMNERRILRKLAGEYLDLSRQDRFLRNRKLHRAVNDLRQIRPVVLIDELPWHEMNINDELTMVCADPVLRKVEWLFRSTIYRAGHFPADMIVQPYIPVDKVIHSTGIGISEKEKTLRTNRESDISAHHYEDQLSQEADLDKIHDPVISYDEDATMRNYQKVGDIVGDILPIRMKGIEQVWSDTWDKIAEFRGVTNLLTDLAVRPEFMHATAKRIHDANWSAMKQYENLGLFDSDPHLLHCTPILTSDLPGNAFEGGSMRLKNVWGRAVAQIFGSVSKEMHKEFDIEYIKPAMAQCGLAYYGCCEPLDTKMDIVETIPNLRKVSITPWADVNIAAEAIGKRYVLSSKPNPASVAVDTLDHGNVRKEVRTILDACKRNRCSCDIVLKDISTCCNRPQNIFEWEEIVMGLVNNA